MAAPVPMPQAREGHSLPLIDQLSPPGANHRVCRRATSLVLSAAFVLPVLVALIYFLLAPLIHRFSSRAQHELPSGKGGGPPTPMDYLPCFPVNNVAQWILLVLLTLACFFNFLVAGSTFLLFARRRIQAWLCCFTPRYPAARRGLKEQLLDSPVSVVVPCYLPNEQHIIGGTIDHILNKLEHTGPLFVLIVYNTPRDLAVEAELHARAATQQGVPPNRRLEVMRVEGSTSKAENLNKAFEIIEDDLTVIYDADHHPDPGSLQRMLRKIANHQVDCVQGSTYIRNVSTGLLARIIDAEFFVTYFIYFVSLQFIAGTAFFGGSNALWRTQALRGEKFSTEMQTEDIEFATRQILNNKRIRFCPEARSGELAPSSLQALYKQRLRWAMGWEQVTIAHMGQVRRARISCGRKLGLVYILPMRWILALLSVVAAILTPILCISYPPHIWPLALDALFTLGFVESSLLVVCTLLESIYHEAFVQCIFVAAFMICSPVYLLCQVTMLLTSLYRILAGNTGAWVVTERAGGGARPGAQPPSAGTGAPGGAPAETARPARVSDSYDEAGVSRRARLGYEPPVNGIARFYARDSYSDLGGMPPLGPSRRTL